ncbi:PDGLE domain-containing protein [Nocardia sp. PE-7]|uniref:PDGLE domain-containing protein n=1 Tax=Nocardia sp. PE-7 TaxID=3058426 RepID=UPI002659EC93|nr:PDGLE domain-containing protein [Nocardia sp. PE-7]WKG13248.1 PDGLE domain-containing protein [Nocardia sp. PE-7]
MFAATAVLVAGVLSYAASPQPDGLDATTRRGCATVEVNGVEELRGECIAQSAEEHRFVGSPLADYAIDGNSDLAGPAGVVGVGAAFAVLFAMVRTIRIGRSGSRSAARAGDVAARSETERE